MAKAEYFVRRGDKERGPTTAARLRELAAAGKIGKDDVIRRGDAGDWFRAGDLAGLFNGNPDDQSELIQDPLVNLASQAAGAAGKAATATGLVAVKLGGAIKGVLARRSESKEAARPTTFVPARPPEQTPILIDTTADGMTVDCPFCREAIKPGAKKCRYCGEILDPVLRKVQEVAAASMAQAHTPAPATVVHVTQVNNNSSLAPRWSPFVAALLSFLIPGLGQLYKGQVINGIVWFFIVLVGYALLVVPGVILHVCCVLGAAMGDPYR